MEEGNSVGEFVSFQQKRIIISLSKQFLFILEDLRDEYNIEPEVYERHRKRILDYGNDSVRELNEYLEKLEIRLK